MTLSQSAVAALRSVSEEMLCSPQSCPNFSTSNSWLLPGTAAFYLFSIAIQDLEHVFKPKEEAGYCVSHKATASLKNERKMGAFQTAPP